MNDTKSLAKFLLVAFLLVFKGISRLMELNGNIIYNVGSFEALLTFSGSAYLKEIKSLP